jgi:hypothetical protein
MGLWCQLYFVVVPTLGSDYETGPTQIVGLRLRLKKGGQVMDAASLEPTTMPNLRMTIRKSGCGRFRSIRSDILPP